MNALRKAGVWLGLVADEEDRPGGEGYDDEFADDDDFAPPARPRSVGRPRSAPSRAADPRTAEHRTADPRSAEHRAGDPRSSDHRPYDHRGAGRDLRVAEPRTAERDTGYERRDTGERDRASVRSLARPAPAPYAGDKPYADKPYADKPHTPGERTYPTQDNLALAPQVQLRERAVVSEDSGRRYQITTLHPTSYSEARTIGEHFRDGFPVIMNLTEMDEPDAKRLVDFAAGLAFGLRGSMERVTNRVFLLSPPNIQVSAEDKARIAEGGFFGQS
jgi:cell division inhibitor SepF